MSIRKLFPSLLVALLAIGLTAAPAKAQNVGAGANVVITDVDLDGLAVANGVLTATGGTISGTIAGLPFTTDVKDFALDLVPNAGTPAGTCAVLDLEIGAISLDLLGAFVNTSDICLNITAIEGGGLLGNLLCGLGDDLLGGLLGRVGGLDRVNDVLSQVLSGVLNGSMAQAQPMDHSAAPMPGVEDICEGECEILDLVVGPVDLTLLGLNVVLDDCTGGPVQVCVSASEGEGLLGDLLCGLAGGGILPDLGAITDLLDAIRGLSGLAGLTDLPAKQLNKLVDQATKALRDGELSDKEINQLTKSVNKLIRKA